MWSGPLVDLELVYPPGFEGHVAFESAGRPAMPSRDGRTLGIRTLTLPLTHVFVSFPKNMLPMCRHDLHGSDRDEFWVLPGERQVSCSFSGGFADHNSGSVGSSSTKGDVSVAFRAPASGGTAHVVYPHEGGRISGAALVEPRWEPRRFR